MLKSKWICFERLVQNLTDVIYLDSYRELSNITKPHITIEDEGKFRCKECKKLFKAAPFVEKHILNKHPEIVGDKLEEVSLLEKLLPAVSLLVGEADPCLNCYFRLSGQVLQQLCAGPCASDATSKRFTSISEQPQSPC